MAMESATPTTSTSGEPDGAGGASKRATEREAEAEIEIEIEPRDDDPDRDILLLLPRARNADLSRALGLLMRRHGTAVYRFCREELHDATLADDVHQQIFIEAHRDLPRFGGRSTLRTWLFGIARHRVLDAAKSRRRAAAHIVVDDTADAPDPSPPPGEQLDEARLQQALVGCLAGLGAHVRTALLLRYQQGFTFDAMAEICHEKAGTLQARVTRALRRLRGAIEAHLCRDSSTGRRVTVRSGGTIAPAPVG
jgi:RNA polymerase sigma factor (sigma-70 family)